MTLRVSDKINQGDFKHSILQKFREKIKKITLNSGILDNKIIRLEFEIDKLNPMTWLINQQNHLKIYWADRENKFEFAGIGKADEISYQEFSNLESAFDTLKQRIKSSDNNLKYFGGIAFDQTVKLEKSWKKFGKFYFIIPQFEVYNDSEKTFLAINIRNDRNIDFKGIGSNALNQFKKINFSKSGEKLQEIKIVNRTDLPEKETWIYNIDSVVKKIKKSDIKKIVLARKTLLESRESINSLHLLKKLKKVNKHTYDFCLQIDNDVSFLGCSPERLFKKIGRQILSEALAGSMPYNSNKRKNRSLLLTSEKDIEEHRYVFNEMYKKLLSLCEEIKILSKKDVLNLSYVQHIYSKFEGLLKPSKQISKIISTLHPTPAVFGLPVKNLTKEMRKYERFDRGWYAAPLGWVSKEDAEFTVSIRSGLINGKILSLFSGAGIVKCSIPRLEWEEIENKINHFLKVLK